MVWGSGEPFGLVSSDKGSILDACCACLSGVVDWFLLSSREFCDEVLDLTSMLTKGVLGKLGSGFRTGRIFDPDGADCTFLGL